MSTNQPNNIGENISNAVYVLRETYRNLDLLFSELDRIGAKEGFTPIGPRFLRWKSDSYYNGWLISNFIKLYQVEKDSLLEHSQDRNNRIIYGIEIDLGGEEESYATISYTRYQFDCSVLNRTPAVSNHWVFYDPFREGRFFEITYDNCLWTSKASEEAKNKYWGMESAVSKELPLVSITSPEDISTKIFQEMENLPTI